MPRTKFISELILNGKFCWTTSQKKNLGHKKFSSSKKFYAWRDKKDFKGFLASPFSENGVRKYVIQFDKKTHIFIYVNFMISGWIMEYFLHLWSIGCVGCAVLLNKLVRVFGSNVVSVVEQTILLQWVSGIKIVGSETIIFGSILTTFDLIFIFLGSWGSIKNFLKLKIEPP